MTIKILCLGEIVGKAGIYNIRHHLDELKKEYDVDFTIANGQGTTGGFGLGRNHSIQLLKTGIDIVTGADKLFYKHDLVANINSIPSVLRPFNLPNTVPGKSTATRTIKEDINITVINMMGTSGYTRIHSQNPFLASDYILKKIDPKSIIIVQFFSMTTAESGAFGNYLDGKVSAVVSTGSKVLTADAKIFSNGTAFITDNGRVGSLGGPHGFDSKIEIEQFITGVPKKSENTFEDLAIQGVVIEVDTETKKAVDIKTICKRYEAP